MTASHIEIVRQRAPDALPIIGQTVSRIERAMAGRFATHLGSGVLQLMGEDGGPLLETIVREDLGRFNNPGPYRRTVMASLVFGRQDPAQGIEGHSGIVYTILTPGSVEVPHDDLAFVFPSVVLPGDTKPEGSPFIECGGVGLETSDDLDGWVGLFAAEELRRLDPQSITARVQAFHEIVASAA